MHLATVDCLGLGMSDRTRRFRQLLTGAAVAVIAAGLPVIAGAQATDPVGIVMPSGDAAATALSWSAFQNRSSGVDEVVLGRDDLPFDNLAAGALQGQALPPTGRQLLLTSSDELLGEVEAEVERLDATTVHLLGGDAALTEAVQASVEEIDGVSSTRLAGETRTETAIAVNDTKDSATALLVRSSADGDPSQAVADALNASGLAAANDWKIFFTTTEELTATTAEALVDQGIVRLVVVGGTAAIADSVMAAADELVDEVVRVGGDTRFDTAAMLNEQRTTEPTGSVVLFDCQGDDAWWDAFSAANTIGLGNHPSLCANAADGTLPAATVEALADTGGGSGFAQDGNGPTLLCAGSVPLDQCGEGFELLGGDPGNLVTLEEYLQPTPEPTPTPTPTDTPAPPTGPRTVTLQLLAFNDYHGHVEAGGAGTVAGLPAGGGEYLSAKLAELRTGQAHSLTVAAGDLIGGSPAFSGLFHDEPSVESLNAMGLDVSSVGNHEFDEGVTELLRMQNGGCHPDDGCYFPEPFAGASFDWLSANVVDDATGDTPLPPYSIENVGGVKVGFIGMTLEATDTLVAAAGVAGYNFLDEADTANALVPELLAQGVKAIVVLLHEGGSQTPPPGDVDACVGISGPIVAINDALDPAIDAIVTGHTHLPYNCRLDDPNGAPRIVTSAYSYGRVVSELTLVLDRNTHDVRRAQSVAVNHPVLQGDLVPDPAITAVIDRWRPLADAAGDTPVGTITADITRGGTPPGSDRGVESPAGNLVADAQLWSTSSSGADVAFMNPGGVRSDLTFAQSGSEGDGVVTFAEAFTFQPFGNGLVTYEMTGAEIVAVLEEQCQPAGSSRPFLHLGVSEGFTYDLSTTIVAGDCTSITISNVQLDGVPLGLADTYDVTVNSFLADGGDNFDTFGTIATPRSDGGNDLEALTNYLGAFSPVAPPPTDRVNEVP